MTIIEYIRAQDTKTLEDLIAEYRTTQETGTIVNESPLRTIAEKCGYPEHTFTMMAFVIYTNALSECYDRFTAPLCEGCEFNNHPARSRCSLEDCKTCRRFYPDRYKKDSFKGLPKIDPVKQPGDDKYLEELQQSERKNNE
jgi:hypothetical protein